MREAYARKTACVYPSARAHPAASLHVPAAPHPAAYAPPARAHRPRSAHVAALPPRVAPAPPPAPRPPRASARLPALRLLTGAALVLLATTTCAQRAVELPFTDAAGDRLRVRAERRPREQAAAARAGRVAATALSPRHAVRSTARLVLARPVPVYAGEAVTVAVRSDLAEFTVDLFSAADTVALSRTVALGGSGTIYHQIVLDTSFELWGLQLHAPAAAAEGHLELAGVAVAAPAGALLVRDAELIAGSGFTPRGGARFDGTALRPVDLELAAWLFPASAAAAGSAAQDGARRPAWPWLLALGLHNPGAPGGELRIHLEGDGMRRSFVVIRQAGRQLVYLHGGEIGFQPRRVLLEHAAAGAAAAAAAGAPATGLFSAAVLALPPGGAGEPPAAVPADLGTILRLDRTHWRRDDFELYEWSGVPGGAEAPVLVFDTADYATQARLFRRLAFFVEKRGFRGQLLGDDELAGRRGYNAHDYAAPDLARFFSLAQEQGLALNDAELLLRSVAVTHGILQPDPGGGWRAGTGAILSISQASYAQLRDLLLRHEALHGLYFTHAPFREAVWAAWQQLTEDEQRFWILLLAAVNYDVDYPDLVVNEFQSYLLQQDANRVANFLAVWNGRLRARHPEHADAIAAVTGATGRWRELHRRLAAALAEAAGIHSDALILLRAADG